MNLGFTSVEKIDPIRRAAELHNETRFHQFLRVLNTWNGSVPERGQRPKERLDIPGFVGLEEIHVTCETRVPVKDHRLAAHDNILRLELMQAADEIQCVRRKVPGLYRCFVTWRHWRMSGESAG